jgi:hypothetical protein
MDEINFKTMKDGFEKKNEEKLRISGTGQMMKAVVCQDDERNNQGRQDSAMSARILRSLSIFRKNCSSCSHQERGSADRK